MSKFKSIAVILVAFIIVGVVSVRYLPSATPDVSPAPPQSKTGGSEDREPAFPENIDDFERVEFVDGDAALESIEMLHGGVPIEAEAGFVATYAKDEDSFVLWVTVSKTEEEAQNLLTVMDEKIPASPVFTNRQVLDVAGNTYYYVTGAGMENFYWMKGARVYWAGIRGEGVMDMLQMIIKNF